MRIGQNPSKNEKVQESFFYHQVIVPVYISKDLDYFKDALSILKYSLESLIISSHQHTFITVVDNGSDEFTKQYLRSLFHSGKIHELIHTNKIGKVNAILKGLVGHNFKLITIADADVLFDAKWQSETYKVFNAFPKAGVICPTPSSKSFRTLTANVWFDLLFSKKLR